MTPTDALPSGLKKVIICFGVDILVVQNGQLLKVL